MVGEHLKHSRRYKRGDQRFGYSSDEALREEAKISRREKRPFEGDQPHSSLNMDWRTIGSSCRTINSYQLHLNYQRDSTTAKLSLDSAIVLLIGILRHFLRTLLTP